MRGPRRMHGHPSRLQPTSALDMPISDKSEIGAVALRGSRGRKGPRERLRVTETFLYSRQPLAGRLPRNALSFQAQVLLRVRVGWQLLVARRIAVVAQEEGHEVGVGLRAQLAR